jgi:hypothetical protein
MFEGTYLLFMFLPAAWSVLTYFFGIQKVKSAGSYFEVAVIAFVVFVCQIAPAVLLAAFGATALPGSSLGLMWSMFANAVLVSGLVGYLTVFGVLASCHYAFSLAKGA